MGQAASVYEMEDNMERPCVRVQLQAYGTSLGCDRTFILSKSKSSMKVGRASSNASRPTSVKSDNCYIASPIMSRNHAWFRFGDKNNPLKLVDDGSTHGTFVDMVRLRAGQEMSVDKKALITFGSEVLNGKSNYSPSRFIVSFTWLDGPTLSTSTVPITSPGIRAPTPPIDSEDEELAHEKGNNRRSPSVIMIGSPKVIDLTDDSNHRERQIEASYSGEPSVFDKEKIQPPSFRDSEGPEELSIIKETNLDSVNRPYRFEYVDSDLEEEQDTTSQSSPPQEDYNSLYDVSDVPANYNPLKSAMDEDDEVQEITNNMEQDQDITTDPIERLQEEEIEAEQSEDSDDEDHESVDYPASLSDSEQSTDSHRDPYHALDGVPGPTASQMFDDLVTYEDAMEYLGASTTCTDRDLITTYYDLKSRQDPAKALQSIELIANYRQSYDLWNWLDTREPDEEKPFHEEEDEEEEDDTEDHDIHITNMDHVLPATVLSSNAQYQSLGHLYSTPMENENEQIYNHQPLQFPIYVDRNVANSQHSSPNYSPFPPAFTTPYVPPAINIGSSSMMSISNLVEPAPIQYTTMAEQIVLTDSVGEMEAVQELINPTADPFVPETHLVQAGKKRKFAELGPDTFESSDDEGPEGGDSGLGNDDDSTAVISSSEATKSEPALEQAVEDDDDVRVTDEANQQEVELPPRKKVKLDRAPNLSSRRAKTFATHCLAGVVGALGVVAALVATTPLQVQEELYRTM